MHISRESLPHHLRLTESECRRCLERKTRDLREYVQHSGFDGLVLGLSGGLDSALSLAIGAAAVGPENMHCYRLPYGQLHGASMVRAAEAAKRFGVTEANLRTVNISASVDAAVRSVDGLDDGREMRTRIGNFAARHRMAILFDQAKAHNSLVLGTENLTEHLMAYYTVGGDEMSSVEPLRTLYKVQVFQVAEAAGVPESILNAAPSAELHDGQTDEDELGCSYVTIDHVLSLTDLPHPLKPKEVSQEDYDRVRMHVRSTYGKRNMPHILK